MPEPRTVLGFDYGLHRIGVAVGQELTGSARPLTTLPGRDWAAIAGLIADWRPALLVVGVPYQADGGAGATARAALRFGRQLHGRFGLPVATIDERLSSFAARDRLGRRPAPGELDRAAAALILESWFNAQASPPCTTFPH